MAAVASSATAGELASFLVSKIFNATNSVSKLVIPSIALAATALIGHAMALSPQQRCITSTSLAAVPPGLASASNKGESFHRIKVPDHVKQLHVVVLVHGWLGSPSEMKSIHDALDRQIKAGRIQSDDDDEGKDNNNEANEEDNHNSSSSWESLNSPEQGEPKNDRIIPDDTMIVVHSASCNAKKTTDGIVAGGGRLAVEVNQLIWDLVNDNPESTEESSSSTSTADVSISFIGNSLGGLYSRCALAGIDWTLPNGTPVVPNVFCTTATPHLGKRGKTYINIPRPLEAGIGLALKSTGQDLFGLNNVMEDLAMDPKYRGPLQRFSKRIAYANAFGSDFQVPTATAAFLADTESPHFTEEHRDPFLLTVTTPRDEEFLNSLDKISSSSTKSATSDDENDPPTEKGQQGHIPATTLSRVLDSMGWEKVFCDVRDKLVSIPVPFQDSESSSSEFEKKEMWTSYDLKATVANRIVHDRKWPIPFGHTMLIANSKSELYAKLNQGGMPFVKQMASDFLDDVLSLQRDCAPLTPTSTGK